MDSQLTDRCHSRAWKPGHLLYPCAHPGQVAFVSTFVLGYCVHLFAFTNLIPNIDGLSRIYDRQNMLMSGRWLLHLASAFHGYIEAPALIGDLSLLFLGISAALTVDLLEITSWAGSILTGAFLVVNIAWAYTYTFIFTASAYAFAILLAVLSVWLVYRVRHGMVAGGAVLALSMGIYQSYISVALSLAVIVFLQYLYEGRGVSPYIAVRGKTEEGSETGGDVGQNRLRNKNACVQKDITGRGTGERTYRWRKAVSSSEKPHQNARRFLRLAGMFIIAVVLYLGILEICLAATGTKLSNYRGMNTFAEGVSSRAILYQLAYAYADFFRYLFTTSNIQLHGTWWVVLNVITGMLIIFGLAGQGRQCIRRKCESSSDELSHPLLVLRANSADSRETAFAAFSRGCCKKRSMGYKFECRPRWDADAAAYKPGLAPKSILWLIAALLFYPLAVNFSTLLNPSSMWMRFAFCFYYIFAVALMDSNGRYEERALLQEGIEELETKRAESEKEEIQAEKHKLKSNIVCSEICSEAIQETQNAVRKTQNIEWETELEKSSGMGNFDGAGIVSSSCPKSDAICRKRNDTGNDTRIRMQTGAACMAAVVFLATLLFHAQYANTVYTALDLAHKSTQSFLTTMVARIQGTPGYRSDMQVIIIGTPDKTLYQNGVPELKLIQTSASTPDNVLTSTKHIYYYLNDWLGVQWTQPTEDEFMEVSGSDTFQSMPLYPDDGSVTIQDDKVIVKLSDHYTPKQSYELQFEQIQGQGPWR